MTEKQRLRAMMDEWREDELGVEQSLGLLNRFKSETSQFSNSLCEQLRIVLEPQLSQQLQGDYRTGKRLNMKKVISFLASHYRNDKIWLRRTMPSKRDYKILLAIDDSLSMNEQNLGFFSLESLVTMVEALNKLEVGSVAVARIRSRMEMLLSFEDSYSNEKSAFILSQFDFKHSEKNSHDTAMSNFVRDANKLLDVQNSISLSHGSTNCPFVIVLSDGRFNKNNVRKYVEEAAEKRYLYIFVILDAPSQKETKAQSTKSQGGIMALRSASKQIDAETGRSEMRLVPYLKDFPFSYYIIVRDLHQLPNALSQILVQWFSTMSGSGQ
uniref:VWFA domain-containing protein n=1 Tax=Strombidium rassoulzadegani TaxID=1082188 RepID=A0A7S3CKX2_9SPIT|mmetsp:Transcript_1505/g.2654  ORF Transcript_1505/g.2654 Transcript_1505/m.2654 type:complete len:326 (+) Transcript_1505:313-1290(+)